MPKGMKRGLVVAMVSVAAFAVDAQDFRSAKEATISGTVVDGETGKAVPSFRMIPGQMHFLRELPLRWDRDNSFGGRDGKFSFRFAEEDLRGDFGLAIEAPGYLPAASPRYTNAGSYTHHFVLKRGEGIRGVAEGPDGKPMAGLTVYLVDNSERVYLRDEAGEIEPYSRNTSTAVTDAEGRFVFEPRLDPNTIIAAHALGYAEVPADQVIKTGKVTIRPWGGVRGVLRVGEKVETNHFVALYTMEYQFGDGLRFRPPLDLRLTTRPDESGKFAFPKVPPGERWVCLQYVRDDPRAVRSHGFAVDVKPGKTAEVTIGGSGYRVTGKVTSKIPVDWDRDAHLRLLSRKHPDEPASSKFSALRAFWMSEVGRAFEREAFQFVPVVRSDGSFHIDNVPPGEYRLSIRATDPKDENIFMARPVGELRTNVVVRGGPMDLGTLELKVKGP
jgi:hypothetical protein